MKILYISTIGITMGFFKQFIQELIKEGHQVDIACNNSVSDVPEVYKELKCKIYTISCSRSVFDTGNLKAINEIRKIVSENHYDIVHCHTPIAATCTRIACRKERKKGTKVIYTAHGFHFYKGAPIKNWMLFYPMEKLCAKLTDVLITINKEDYELAKRKFKANRIEYVPGVGIDIEKFKNVDVDKEKIRNEIGVPNNAVMLLSVGEVNQNKNHQIVIKAMAQIKNEDIHYVIAGEGELKERLVALAMKYGISDRVHLLGYRKDVINLYKTADIYIHPSRREGLPVAVMEAMAAGLPCIVSNVRGNADLIEDGLGGYLCNNTDDNVFAENIQKAMKLQEGANDFSEFNILKIKDFSKEAVFRKVAEIYEG